MAKKFLVSLDLLQNQLLNAVIHRAASAPVDSVNGQVYYNTTDNRLYIYNGTAWVDALATDKVAAGEAIGISVTNNGNDTVSTVDVLYDNVTITLNGSNQITLKDGGITDAKINPTSNIQDAINKRHVQNTDTGTTSQTFKIDSGNGGVTLKHVSGELQVRSGDDADFADIRVKNLYVEGTQTIVDSTTVAIGDSIIELNSGIADYMANSDGGITVKRLSNDNTTRIDAQLLWKESAKQWYVSVGADEYPISRRFQTIVGDGSNSTFLVEHKLGNKFVTVNLYSTATGELYECDVVVVDNNNVQLSFSRIPTSGEFTVVITG